MTSQKTLFTLAVGFVLISFFSIPALAQRFESADVKNPYLGFGMGTGSTYHGYEEVFTDGDRTSGFLGTLRFGFIIKKSILLGIESNSSLFEIADVDWTFGSSAITLTYYPHRSFFIKGGPAVANMSYEFKTNAPSFSYHQVSDYTAGVQIAFGADIQISRHYSVMPTVHYIYADFDEFTASTLGLTLEFVRFW